MFSALKTVVYIRRSSPARLTLNNLKAGAVRSPHIPELAISAPPSEGSSTAGSLSRSSRMRPSQQKS